MSSEQLNVGTGGTETPPEGAVCIYYHGTDIESAKYMEKNGVNYRRSMSYGGDGKFYLTPDFESAKVYAVVNPAEGPPAVLGFGILESKIQQGKDEGTIEERENDKALICDRKSFKMLNQSMINPTVHIVEFRE